MNLVFDIFPADDVRGTRLVRLTSDDYLQGTMFRTELVGMGKGRLVLQADQAVATAANLARDNYVEVFDLTLSGAYALGAFFLEEGDFAALSSREQAGRILTFGGRGELSYLSRGVLGPTALSGAHGPLDQHWIDTLGSWKWGSLGSETYGAILRRIIYESALMTPDPLPEVQLVDIGWDDVVDSDAVPWPGFTGEYDIPVGTNLLEAAADLLKYGIELVANSDFEYRAYNAGGYGTNRTSATFATNKVRFEAGVNIAADLSRAIHGATDASHALLKDRTGFAFELVTSPVYSPGDVVRYVGITSPESTGPDDLVDLGEGVLTNRRDFVDQFAFPHPTGYAPLTGLYTPGPPASAAHYWKGDYVTIHTGTSPYDANEQTIRVAAIEWNVDDAGNWLPTVELGAQYLSIGQANLQNQLSSLVSSSHTHPPNPELCRPGTIRSFSPVASLGAVCSLSGSNFDSVVVSETKVERVDLTTGLAAAVGQCIVVITGSQNNASPTGVWDDAGNAYTLAANHGDSAGAPNPRASIWYTNVTAPLSLGAAIHYEVGVGSSLSGSIERGGKCISAYLFDGGLYTPVASGTNAAVNTSTPNVTVGGGELIVAAGEENGGASGFPDTITLDPDWTAFTGAATTASSTDASQIWGGFRIGDSGGEAYGATIDQNRDWAMVGATFTTGVSASSARDGHPDLVGTSIRASRCDHRHDLHRIAPPTVTDDSDAGYRTGTNWAVLDDLTTPTAIDSVWILADDTPGAAVWLELPTGGGAGGTIDVEEEGTPEGTVDTLNFTGDATLSVVGSTGTVNVTASGSGAMTLITDTLLGSDTASFDFTSISGSYKHLRLVLAVRSARAANNNDTMVIRFNNDSGSNYDYVLGQFHGASSATANYSRTEAIAAASPVCAVTPGATSPAGAHAELTIDINNYAATVFRKGWHSVGIAKLADSSTNIRPFDTVGEWRSTAAITRITLTSTNSANWLTGSRVSLYGIS